MSTLDAEARGIKTGDLVLMTSPHGQVLRPAKVLPTIVPGAVALQDGAWIRIDEETGIDLGGDPNHSPGAEVLGRGIPVLDGHAGVGGEVHRPADARPRQEHALVMPVGIEE